MSSKNFQTVGGMKQQAKLAGRASSTALRSCPCRASLPYSRALYSTVSTEELNKPKEPIRLKLGQEGGRQYVPQGYWRDKANVIKALERAEELLGITKPDDWYSVTLADLRQIGFPSSANRVKLAELLVERYPEHQWETVLLFRGKLAQQKRLEKAVTSLFPNVEIKTNARKDSELINPETLQALELDIYIPSLSLAFEYQEIHHYISSGYTYNPIDYYVARDSKKKELAQQKGLTLITVPCWWDGKKESLVATIHEARPDLLVGVSAEGASPIADAMPPQFLAKNAVSIDDIGMPTNACFFSLSNVDPSKWWMFEKYDGLRGFWNPLKKAFYSRLGNKFQFPQEVIDSMPTDIFLDGELWFGRDNFQEALKISHRTDLSLVDWSKFKYMVFDIPTHKGKYQERWEQLAQYLQEHKLKYVQLATMEECKDIQHLETFFQDVIDKGGEGVILRDPNAPFQPGRSPGYLKHKKFRDAEARVVRYIEPLQWLCEMPNGVLFTAPAVTSTFTKRWAPKPGDIVSFKHHGFLLSSKKPKLPAIYRLRPDLTWDTVVQNFKEQITKPTALPLRRLVRHKPKGYWHQIENRRKFFNEFADRMGFDPSSTKHWRNVTIIQLLNKMDSVGPITIFNNSLKTALENTYPELNFNFKERKQNEFWKDQENRKKFFLDYAAQEGFDPYVPANWEKVTKAAIQAKQASAPYPLFRGSLHTMLAETFPQLKFDETDAKKLPKGYWQNASNRRQHFLAYAAEMGFDPNVPENWQRVSRAEFVAKQGTAILAPFDGSLSAALRSTFPELEFKFSETIEARRKPIPKRGHMPWIRSFFNS